jgi:hypothetical protein
LKVCPHYGEIWQEWHAWFLSTGRFPAAEQRQRVTATDYPYLGAASWPACDQRRLWDITCLSALLIESDDDYDANRAGYGDVRFRQQLLQATAADFRMADVERLEPRWGPLFAQTWRSLSEYVQPRVLRRLAEQCARYVEGCAAVDGYLATHGEFINVPDYLDIRYYTVGQLIDHVFVEISLGIDLGDVIDDPVMTAIIDSDIRRTIISQDFLSLRKELSADGGQVENLVVVLARSKHCPLTEALAIATDLYAAENQVFDRLAEQITRTPLGRLPEVVAFIHGLNDFAAGYMDWTAGSGRYTLRDTCPWWDSLHQTGTTQLSTPQQIPNARSTG